MKNSIATLVRRMRKHLHGLELVESYIDDLIVNAMDWDSHLQMLDDLLRWLQQAHLAVRPTKCLFGSKFVEFLDHLVGGNCITMYEENLKKIRQTKRSWGLQTINAITFYHLR